MVLSQFLDDKPFKGVTREHIVGFPDRIRKRQASDLNTNWLKRFIEQLHGEEVIKNSSQDFGFVAFQLSGAVATFRFKH